MAALLSLLVSLLHAAGSGVLLHLRSERSLTRPACAQLSGQRILTMEYVDGCRLTDLACLRGTRFLRLHGVATAVMLHAICCSNFLQHCM